MTPRRTLAALLAVVLAASALAGCAPRDDGPSGRSTGETERRTMSIDGIERTYLVHVPPDLAAEPALVLMLHGGFGSGRQAERAYGWNARADAAGFVIAYPDGIGRTWNAGDCCGSSAREDVDDVTFLTKLVATLQEDFGIDSARTFATGMSNGAMMTYRLACETSLFAAIAPVAGTVVTACDDPATTSVLHVHGLDDSSVRMDGTAGDGAGKVDGMPVDDAVALWSAAGDCGDAVVTEEGDVTTSTTSCTDGVTVTLVTVAGAGHQWPGSVPREGAEDPPSDALDATTLIWEFFDAA
jgi:polyhydroxybutyrate depolymerase